MGIVPPRTAFCEPSTAGDPFQLEFSQGIRVDDLKYTPVGHLVVPPALPKSFLCGCVCNALSSLLGCDCDFAIGSHSYFPFLDLCGHRTILMWHCPVTPRRKQRENHHPGANGVYLHPRPADGPARESNAPHPTAFAAGEYGIWSPSRNATADRGKMESSLTCKRLPHA